MKTMWDKILVGFAAIAILSSFVYSLATISTQTFFYYDQARDAYEAYSIWHNHNIKILGPSSDIPGIHHGVIWFYFLALLYFLGNGIPENAVLILVISLYAFVPVVAYLTYRMTKDVKVTAVTTSLYALSPLHMAFTHWLSNPVLALFIAPPLFYLLWRYIHQRSLLIAALVGLFFGLLIQSDFGFIVLLFLMPLYYFVFSLRFSLRDILSFSGGLLLGLLPFFVTYLKFKTNIVSIIWGFLSESGHGGFPLVERTISLFENAVKFLNISYLPLPGFALFILLIAVLFRFRKSLFKSKEILPRLSLLWLLGVVLIFVFNRGNLSALFFYAPFLYPLALLLGVILAKTLNHASLLFICLLLISVGQSMVITTWAKNEESPLSIQKKMTLHYEKELVTYIYESAEKKPFVITTITNPLYINTTWSYLFTTYGKPKYDYVPYFWGQNQEGYLGDLPMQTSLDSPVLRYLIIESSEGIEKHWIEKLTAEEDLISDVVEEKKFGNFTVQKRLFHHDKNNLDIPSDE